MKIRTVAPVAVTLASAASKRAARSSVSHWNRMMSLPPPQNAMRSGRSRSATGICSATIWSSSFPRTARFAYRKPGRPAPICSATRSAQPRGVPSARQSSRPSVKLSPIATKLFQVPTATASLVHCLITRGAGVDRFSITHGHRSRQ